MEEREKLQQDLRRYSELLIYTTDEQATAAIRELIRNIRDRLDRLEGQRSADSVDARACPLGTSPEEQ